MHSHPYHIVDPSPWPLAMSMAVLTLASGAVLYFHQIDSILLLLGFTAVAVCMGFWCRDIVLEANTPGTHTPEVQTGLKIGMILFIASEVMFFAAFFGSYFYSALRSDIWPPKGLEVIDPFGLPYFNTLLLLLSGTTVTWAHHSLLENDKKGLINGLLLTVVLGLVFLAIQMFEYHHAPFAFKDGIYASNFYMATGFHGFHVFVGSIFLLVALLRARRGEFTPKHHVGFEAAAWYWHFVDVVWLFLFIAIYWGST